MTYTTIDDTEILPDKPITTSLMTRLRDNPIAIANGDAGAPSIKYVAIDSTTFNRILSESAVISGKYGGESWAELHTPAANNDAAAIRCRDGKVVYFAAERASDTFTNGARNTWYYPIIESGNPSGVARKFFTVGAVYNPLATTIDITVKAIISLQVDGAETGELRLLVDDSVVETITGITAGTRQVITFSARTIAASGYEVYSVQGLLESGAGTDALILDSIFIIPSLS